MIMLLRYNYQLEGHIKVNEETSSKPLETSQRHLTTSTRYTLQRLKCKFWHLWVPHAGTLKNEKIKTST